MVSFLNKIRKISILLFGAGLIIISTLPSAWATDEFVMGWESWEPFQYKNGQGEITGLDIDLISAIMGNIDMKTSFKEMPWKRHLTLLEGGSVHIAAGASKTSEREAYAHFSDPYRTEAMVLYIRKGESKNYADFKTLDQLPQVNFTIGVVNGYYYGENYAELIKDAAFKAKTEAVNKNELNIKKVVGGRIDGFLMDPAVATARLKEMNLLDKLEIFPVEIYEDEVHVMFSKKSTDPSVVAAFNESLKTLKANGSYLKIMNKYIQR